MTTMFDRRKNAELLTGDDAELDMAVLTDLLLAQRAERIARNILLRPDTRAIMEKLLATHLFVDEEDALARSLKVLQTALIPE